MIYGLRKEQQWLISLGSSHCPSSQIKLVKEENDMTKPFHVGLERTKPLTSTETTAPK